MRPSISIAARLMMFIIYFFEEICSCQYRRVASLNTGMPSTMRPVQGLASTLTTVLSRFAPPTLANHDGHNFQFGNCDKDTVKCRKDKGFCALFCVPMWIEAEPAHARAVDCAPTHVSWLRAAKLLQGENFFCGKNAARACDAAPRTIVTSA